MAKSFTEQLREAVRDSGTTRYQISMATRIQQSALARFVSGERFLSPGAIDKLADYLELEIRHKPRKRGH